MRAPKNKNGALQLKLTKVGKSMLPQIVEHLPTNRIHDSAIALKSIILIHICSNVEIIYLKVVGKRTTATVTKTSKLMSAVVRNKELSAKVVIVLADHARHPIEKADNNPKTTEKQGKVKIYFFR